MTQYTVDIQMKIFELTKSRGHNGDDLWFYWKVQVLEGQILANGNFAPPVDSQMARLHWPYPVSSGGTVDTGLNHVKPSWWTNPYIQPKDRLQAKVTLKAGQFLRLYYLVENLSGEEHDPNSRSRKFNNTVSTVENAINMTETVGAFTPWGPAIVAAGELAKLGLDAAEAISNAIDGPGQPVVNCSGLVSDGVWSITADDLIASLGTNAIFSDEFTLVNGQPAPNACGGGSTGTATISYSVERVPEFIEESHEDSSTWKLAPASGLPLNVWNGTWGETRSTRHNKIECEIKLRRLFAPGGQSTPSFLTVRVREVSGTPPHYIVNATSSVYYTFSEAEGQAIDGGGSIFLPHSDTIHIDAGSKLITLRLYSARDSHHALMEYRIKYTQTDNITNHVVATTMLVPAHRLG